MAIDRIGTAANANLLLNHILQRANEMNRTTKQVSSGYVADNYTGYGNKTAALEAARSSAAKADANIAVARQALTRLDLQDLLLSQFGTVADELRQALTQAEALGDGSVLMTEVRDLFEQAVTILNSKDGSGYLFSGEFDQTAPVTVATLDDLAALPSVADAFANGTVERELRIGENRTVQVGLLASDLATDLFTLFRDIAQFDQGVDGPFGTNVTPAQDAFLTGAMQDSIDAASGINIVMAGNGDRYRLVDDAITGLEASKNVYAAFAAEIQDVDIGEAMARLNQNQVALQASYQIAATINQLSLLNFLL